jgi:hypothetical protein
VGDFVANRTAKSGNRKLGTQRAQAGSDQVPKQVRNALQRAANAKDRDSLLRELILVIFGLSATSSQDDPIEGLALGVMRSAMKLWIRSHEGIPDSQLAPKSIEKLLAKGFANLNPPGSLGSNAQRRYAALRAVGWLFNRSTTPQPVELYWAIDNANSPPVNASHATEPDDETQKMCSDVIGNWTTQATKWALLNNLLALWGLQTSNKRRGGTKSSGAVHPLAQDWQRALKVGA